MLRYAAMTTSVAMSRSFNNCLLAVLAAGLAGCQGPPQSDNGADNAVAMNSASPESGRAVRPFYAPPDASTPPPHRHGWMSIKGEELEQRIKPLLGCGSPQLHELRLRCDSGAFRHVVPLDRPFDHVSMQIIVGKYVGGPLPLPRGPFAVIHDLFPKWREGDAWLRHALRQANHRRCPVGIKIDDVWIIVEGVDPGPGPYEYATLYLSPYDFAGQDVAACNAEPVD